MHAPAPVLDPGGATGLVGRRSWAVSGSVMLLLWPSLSGDGPSAWAFPLQWTWAAIWEEAVFRGWLQPWIDARLGADRLPVLPVRLGITTGNLIASLAFAAVHGLSHPMVLLPAYLVVSLLLGVARSRSQGLAWPIALHFAFNLIWWRMGG